MQNLQRLKMMGINDGSEHYLHKVIFLSDLSFEL